MTQSFQNAIKSIKNLKNHDEYIAALIFGSIARGGYSDQSDLDVVIITKTDREFKILHPYIQNIKLDLSYRSFNQIEKEMQDQVKKKNREPMIARCKILFDKDGRLTRLVDNLNKIEPEKVSQKEIDDIQFLIYHFNNKIERSIKTNPTSAQLSMHTSISEVLTAHYRINRRWVISSKKMLEDLKAWDKPMFNKLSKFLNSNSLEDKKNHWDNLIEYILKPLGGAKDLQEGIPKEYQEDIKLLTK